MKHRIEFTCKGLDRAIIKKNAKNAGLSIASYCRKCALDKDVKEILNDEQIEFYKMLIKYHNNFKSIGNLIKNKEAGLFKLVNETALEIKNHLKNFN